MALFQSSKEKLISTISSLISKSNKFSHLLFGPKLKNFLVSPVSLFFTASLKPYFFSILFKFSNSFDFMERLISIALPRTRDFRGLSFKSFDGRGNYSFGVKEQIIFTEIDYDKIQSIRGMNITLCTSAETDDEAYELLKMFGLPLRDKPAKKESIEAV